MIDDLAAKFAAELAISSIEKTLENVSKPAKSLFRTLLLSVSDAYTPFLESTFRRVKTIKTFLKPNEPVDLLNSYVAASLSCGTTTSSPEDILNDLKPNSRIVISGLAGRGKSVLMRYLALSLYHAPRGQVPIFLELRTLNTLTTIDILQFIHAQYKGNSNIDIQQMEKAASNGYFIFLFDGFDEISPEKRPEVERQIQQIADKFQKCPLIISGRPDERFSAWEHFSTWLLKPMKIDQITQLILCCDYDSEVKTRFSKMINVDFFKKHESFLNTPLLAIMMMISYNDRSEIPDSLHEFYQRAFDALLRRHDAQKSNFLRENHSKSSAENFIKIFSDFSCKTYASSKFIFTRDEILNLIADVLKKHGMNESADLILADLIESICVLQEEGFEISFVHRSFQEYFCALAVSKFQATEFSNFLSKGRFAVRDSVFPMLFGLVPDRFVSEWAKDEVLLICSEYPQADARSEVRFLKHYVGGIEITIHKQNSVSIRLEAGQISRDCDVIRKVYPECFNFGATDNGRNAKTSLKLTRERDKDIIEAMIKRERLGDVSFKGVERASTMPINFKNADERKFILSVSEEEVNLLALTGLIDFSREFIRGLNKIRKIHEKQDKISRDFYNDIIGVQ